MKILVISPTAIRTPPQGYGGVELLTYCLVKELERMGHRVTLAAAPGSYKPNGGLIEAYSEDEFAKLIDPYDFDVIHDWTHTKIAKQFIHPKIFSTPFWTDEKGLNPIYPSRAVAHAFGEPYGIVVYPGIEVEKYPLIESREDYLIYFGRIAPIKGVEKTIMLAKKAGVRLKVVGHAGWAAYDRRYVDMIRSMCTGKIEWIGEVSQKEKIDLLGHAKAMIFTPTWLESFGLVVTESMLLGTPVICGGIGGHVEQIIHGVSGYYLSSPNEIFDAIKVVEELDPKKVRERGLYFNSRRMAEDYLKVYGVD